MESASFVTSRERCASSFGLTPDPASDPSESVRPGAMVAASPSSAPASPVAARLRLDFWIWRQICKQRRTDRAKRSGELLGHCECRLQGEQQQRAVGLPRRALTPHQSEIASVAGSGDDEGVDERCARLGDDERRQRVVALGGCEEGAVAVQKLPPHRISRQSQHHRSRVPSALTQDPTRQHTTSMRAAAPVENNDGMRQCRGLTVLRCSHWVSEAKEERKSTRPGKPLSCLNACSRHQPRECQHRPVAAHADASARCTGCETKRKATPRCIIERAELTSARKETALGPTSSSLSLVSWLWISCIRAKQTTQPRVRASSHGRMQLILAHESNCRDVCCAIDHG
eukprot:1395990-Rhodomonas_salina.2